MVPAVAPRLSCRLGWHRCLLSPAGTLAALIWLLGILSSLAVCAGSAGACLFPSVIFA